MAGKTNVFPVLDNKFKVGAAKGSASTIADMESFSVSITNGVETWTPMDTEGWQRALMTAKAITITLSGKRNIGDTGNDFVAGKMYKNGHDAEVRRDKDGNFVVYSVKKQRADKIQVK